VPRLPFDELMDRMAVSLAGDGELPPGVRDLAGQSAPNEGFAKAAQVGGQALEDLHGAIQSVTDLFHVEASPVTFPILIQNIDYSKLQANVNILNEFLHILKRAVASETNVAMDNITVKLSPGSVMAQITIMPHSEKSREDLMSRLSSSDPLANFLATSLKTVRDIQEVSSGVISVIAMKGEQPADKAMPSAPLVESKAKAQAKAKAETEPPADEEPSEKEEEAAAEEADPAKEEAPAKKEAPVTEEPETEEETEEEEEEEEAPPAEKTSEEDPARVTLSLAIKNMDYSKVQADSKMQKLIKESIRSPIASEANVPSEAVAVKLKQGSLVAEVSITPPEETNIEEVQSALATSKSLGDLVATSISTVDGVEEVTSGDLVVSVSAKPKIEGQRPGEESDDELEEEKQKEEARAEADEEVVTDEKDQGGGEEDDVEEEAAAVGGEGKEKLGSNESHQFHETERLRKLIVKETNSTGLADMLAGMKMDIYRINERMGAMEKDLQDGVKLDPGAPDESIIFPLSVCLRCVLMLGAQYIIVYTCMAFCKAFTDMFGLGDSTMFAVALEHACETVFYAPMLCVLFLGANLRALQITQGAGGPQQITELAMQACAFSVLVQTLLALAVPIFLDRDSTGKVSLGIELPSSEGRAVAGLLTLIRYAAMATLYVGFVVVSVQVLLMDTRSLDAHPVDMWDNPKTEAIEYAPPVSPAMSCTLGLTMLFFAIYLFLAVAHSCKELSRNHPEWLLKTERAFACAAQAVDLAPMICILFMTARTRALTIDPKSGKLQPWADVSFFVGAGAITVLTVAGLLREVLEPPERTTAQKARLGAMKVRRPTVRFSEEELGEAERMDLSLTDLEVLARGLTVQERVVVVIRWISTLGVYGAGIVVIAATLALGQTMEAGKMVAPPLSPTTQCVLVMAVLYFVVYLGLFFFEARAGLLDANLEVVSLVGSALRSSEYAVKFCPMLAILFVGTRARALQLSDYRGSPQCWSQDAMYVASAAVFLQLLCALVTSAFFDTASSSDPGDRSSTAVSDKASKRGIARIVVEFMKILAMVALYGASIVVVASVLTIRPETAFCEMRGVGPRHV